MSVIDLPVRPTTPEFRRSLRPFVMVGVAILGLALLFFACTYRVDMTHQAVVTRFSEVVKVVVPQKTPEIVAAINAHPQLRGVTVVEGRGLFFKLPFFDRVEYYLTTLLSYDTDPREVTTLDKKKIVLDNFAQWRIDNPAAYYVTMRDERVAHQRIDDILYSQLNAEIGKIEATKLISDRAYVLSMMDFVATNVNKELSPYGMEIVDIRIKRTELPTENMESIYARMRTEREQQAMKYRSEGDEEAQKIRSDADRQAQILISEAYATAQQVRGQGDAEAARIYAEAYNRDAEFYRFFRTLQTYKTTLGDKTTLVIPQDSEFASFLFGTK